MSTPPPIPPHQPPPLPEPVNYFYSPTPRMSAGQMWLRFFLGLAVGVGVSVLFWVIGWKALVDSPGWQFVVFGLPLAKLIFGISVMFMPRHRPLGIGVILSIGLGFLIFGYKFIVEVCGTQHV